MVEVAGGLGVGEDPAAIERPPDAVAGGWGAVRDDDMGMQQRVAFAAGAMHERRGNEPAARSGREAVVAAADRAGLTLEEPDRGSDSCRVRGDDLRRDVGWGERPRDRDRLRCPERQIEPADAPIVRDAEPGPALRVPVVEDRGQVHPDDVTRQPEQRRRRAPHARRRVGAEVVVLDTRHDRLRVIGLDVRAGEDLHVQHDRVPATPPKHPPIGPSIADASLCSPSEHSPTPRPTAHNRLPRDAGLDPSR